MRLMLADRNERLIPMIRESLILTSVTASVDLEDAVPRGRRRKTASECERVVSFFENLACISNGTVAVAGRNCLIACVVAPSPEATGGANDPRLGCSGRILLLGAESGQVSVRFKVRRGRGDRPGSLTLTLNPSRLLTGADAQPTLVREQSQTPFAYPSTAPRVMDKLLEIPFELLAAIIMRSLTRACLRRRSRRKGFGSTGRSITLLCLAPIRTVSSRFSQSRWSNPSMRGGSSRHWRSNSVSRLTNRPFQGCLEVLNQC
jgi:hypothetical protein